MGAQAAAPDRLFLSRGVRNFEGAKRVRGRRGNLPPLPFGGFQSRSADIAPLPLSELYASNVTLNTLT